MAVLAGMALFGGTAQADVKAGVEAWRRGEYRRAVDEWRPLAVKGDADAQFNLGQAYKLGRGVPVDPGLAEQWYGKAAAQGHEAAIANYGLALFQNGKRDEAVPWLEKAANRGEPRAQLVLGTMLFNGDSVPKDWVRAYALVTRAAAAKVPKANETVAQMDDYIPSDVRQRGLALARQYEDQASAPAPSGDIADAAPPMRTTELPPSRPATTPPPASTDVATSAPPPAAKPAPRPAPPPRPATVANGAWRVQFGAFRDEANAKRLWESLQARVRGLGALQPFLVKAGGLTKLQAGGVASPAAAAKLCAEVRAAAPGQACVPTR